jgi:iron complex transport system substrate-binding protein
MLDDLTGKQMIKALTTMGGGALRAVLGAFILNVGASFASENPTQKSVVSTDYCADQYVLALADRDQIKAVSKEALDVHSFHREKAKSVPVFNGSAEEILAKGPDTVVWSWRGSRTTDALFKRTGTDIAHVNFALTADEVFRNVVNIADALDKPQKGQAMVADYRVRLSALESSQRHSLKAVYVTPGGFTAGMGTFVDNVIKLSGFDTVAGDMGLKGWQPVPLEALVLNPPDVIIGSFFDLRSNNQSNWGLTRHPLLNRMMQEIPTILVPSKYLSCNGFFFVDGAEYIREEAENLGLFPPIAPGREGEVK